MSEYRIYPTLLDKFQGLLDYEQEAEQPWNKVSEAAHNRGEHLNKDVGDYILTPDECALRAEVELIDTLNRCEYGEIPVAADRGSCLNEIVDCMVQGVPSTRADIKVVRLYVEQQVVGLRATMNGNDYDFDIALCRQLADYFAGSLAQVMVEGVLPTAHGNVTLYGYIDYWLRDRVLDLKTTSVYDFGKYERKWQRYAYPYLLTAQGYEISEMEFTAVQLTKGTLIGGKMYPERYTHRQDTAETALREICERFIEWLGTVEPAITCRRIYDEDDRTAGKPIALHGKFNDAHLDELRRWAYQNGF